MDLHKDQIKLSIIVSTYNEEQTIELFYNELKKVLNEMVINHEIVFVNDESNDNSLNILSDLSQQDPQITVVSLSRNFGHEATMIAGIDYSTGDAVICMDADLQHPSLKVKEMVDNTRVR